MLSSKELIPAIRQASMDFLLDERSQPILTIIANAKLQILTPTSELFKDRSIIVSGALSAI